MELVKLTPYEFEEYASTNIMSSIYQTKEYERFLQENGFECDYIGLKDNYNRIIAASLIGYKKLINNYTYGYAPGGFLIDYKDTSLVKDFCKALSSYYKDKKMVFIKIIPNIIISKLDKETNEFKPNNNIKYIKLIKDAKAQELKSNKYFESILPKYRPLINLKTFQYSSLHKNVRNKIRKSYKRGLSIEKVSIDKLKELYPFIKNKSKKPISYYESLYHSFEKEGNIDLFLVSVDFEEYLINFQSEYDKELIKNNKLVKELQTFPSNKVLDAKMQSDKELINIKNNIVTATNGLARNKKQYIAGAIILKYKNQAIIFESGYNKKYKDCNSNYYLNYKLIEYYKYNYDILDMNGFTGDLTKGNPYYGVNEFKLGFNADVYETIGEFDIIFDKHVYKKISSNGTLAKIFEK